MNRTFFIILSLFTLLISSCINDEFESDWTEKVIIEVSPDRSEYILGEGNGQALDGMLIRKQGQKDWTNVYKGFIKGFDNEYGTAYTLLVKITHLSNPPQDDSNIRMELLEVISCAD